MTDFSAMLEVVSVPKKLMLLGRSSPGPPHRPVEWSFPLILPSPSRQALLGKRGVFSSLEDSAYLQLIIFPVELNIVQIRHLVTACVHILCTYTWECSSLISLVPFWLESIAARARWLLKRSCFWDNNKLQAARGISWEYIVSSWSRSFTVRVSESGSKWKDHSMPSLETKKIMLLYCRLKVYKMRMQKIFWLTVSTNGYSIRSSHKKYDCCLFWQKLGCVWLWLADNFPQKRRWLFFFVVATRLFCKTMSTISTKKTFVDFCSVNGILSTWEQVLQFLQSWKLEYLIVERSTYFSF